MIPLKPPLFFHFTLPLTPRSISNYLWLGGSASFFVIRRTLVRIVLINVRTTAGIVERSAVRSPEL